MSVYPQLDKLKEKEREEGKRERERERERGREDERERDRERLSTLRLTVAHLVCTSSLRSHRAILLTVCPCYT